MSTVSDCIAKHKQCLGANPSPEQACRCTFEFVQCIHCGVQAEVQAAMVPNTKPIAGGAPKRTAAVKSAKKKV